MSIDGLEALQKRVREATGADGALDIEIVNVLMPGCWPVQWGIHAPRFTTYPEGLGPCVAMLRSVVPQATCYGFDVNPQEITAYVSRNCVGSGHWLKEGWRSDGNGCLALLDAIISAKLSLSKEKEARSQSSEGAL